MPIVPLLLIGAAAGVSAGLFGIGGGTLIVPALIYFLSFSQHKATGTSLAVLLPPVGIAAVVEYYRHGNVDLTAAAIMAAGLAAGAWAGAFLANKLSAPQLKLVFGIFLTAAGVQMIVTAARKL